MAIIAIVENAMKTLSARDAKNSFGVLLDTAQREPVTIEKKGRPVAVLLSIAEYERLEALEDAYWSARAGAAEAEGYVGPDAGEQLLRELLDAKD
jgi:prevent-host-death family protein